MIKIEYSSLFFTVRSSGMLLQNDGTIFMALDLAEPTGTTIPNMRLASFDSVQGKMNYMMETAKSELGHSAALAQSPDDLYLGGSYAITNWHLAFIKISNKDDPSTAKISTLAYKHTDCTSAF